MAVFDVCDVYREPNVTNFVASLVIAVGIVISYVPQYVKIVQTRTSVGLSPTFLFLISVAGFSAMSNLVLLSSLSLPCCSELTGFECVNSQVSLIQVGLQAISTLFIPLLCVIYTNTPDNTEYEQVVEAWRRILLYIATVTILVIVACFTFSAAHVLLFAQILGVLSTVITFIQYIPQLVETYHLKHSGALSIAMMLIQTPGGFLWTTTLIMKPGSNWSSWLPYLAAASLQGVLLIMCIYYDYYLTPKQALLDQQNSQNYV